MKTVLTNVVVEHVKSRMSKCKNKATVSPWFITSLNMLMCKCYDGNFTDFIHESYHIYKTALIAKN